MKNPESEIIVEVGAEGGRLTLRGTRAASGWVFCCDSFDQSAVLLLGEPSEATQSATVVSWSEALALLDSYPWHMLYPLEVHPEFRAAVFDAVKLRYANMPDLGWNRLEDWKALCGVPVAPTDGES